MQSRATEVVRSICFRAEVLAAIFIYPSPHNHHANPTASSGRRVGYRLSSPIPRLASPADRRPATATPANMT
jgi:hypothetical protein